MSPLHCFHVWKKEPVNLIGHEAGIHMAFCVEKSRFSGALSSSQAVWFWGWLTCAFREAGKGPLGVLQSLRNWVHQSSEQRKKLVFFDRFSVIFTGPPDPDELLSFIFRLSFVIISRASVKNASSTFVLDFALVSKNLIP